MSKPFDQVLEVSLSDIINCEGIESFNDMIEGLARAAGSLDSGVLLCNLSFKPVGISINDELIRIRVVAEIEEY